MLKDLIRPIIYRLVQIECIYSFLANTILPLAHAIQSGHKRWILERAIIRLIGEATPIVKHGPFAGMLYPNLASIGSALFPKLLGSYERELHAVFNNIISSDYTEIVDIGCAEGYYAIGLALRFPPATIYAFDIVPKAIRLCAAMAQANGVDNRLKIDLECTPEKLVSLPLTGRALVVSDCEGYEKILFSEAVVTHLSHHDVLIEIHDFYDPDIGKTIRQRFYSTHDIQVIESVDDYHKALFYEYPELHGYEFEDRRTLLAENRPTIMQWYFMKGRQL